MESKIWNEYTNIIKYNIKTWDYIILVSMDENQAKFYKEEIDKRILNKTIPNNIKYIVISSNQGIGSGGAFFKVLNYLNSKRIDLNSKILVIFSGGNSKRIPKFSIIGKVFIPLLYKTPNNEPYTIFDDIIIKMVTMMNASKIPSGIMSLAGDVVLNYDYNDLSKVDFRDFDSNCLTVKTLARLGQNHGVYVTNKENVLVKFLHKETLDVLDKNNAIDENRNVNIDVGSFFIKPNVINKLISLINTYTLKTFVNENLDLNLYGDVVYTFSQENTFKEYLNQNTEGKSLEKLQAVRKILWENLHEYKLKVSILDNGKFIHLGTTKEFYEALNDNYDIADYLEYQKGNKDNYLIYDNSNMQDINFDKDTCIDLVKLKDNTYVSIIYAVNDNFKKLKILNKDILDVFDYYKLIKVAKRTNIWEFEIYKKSNTKLEAFNNAYILYKIINKELKQNEVEKYFESNNLISCKSIIKEYKKYYIYNEDPFKKLKNDIVKNLDILNVVSTKDSSQSSSSLRINFAGGWTDTPPYSIDNGGIVLNTAINVNGEKPVTAKILKINKKQIILESIDLNSRIVISDINSLKDFNEDDPFKIHKASLYIAGIFKLQDNSLEEVFNRCDNLGFIFTTNVKNIPKGSGLGTSSILAGVAIKTLFDFINVKLDDILLFNKVLALEQLIGTGGGWQDQIGGLIPGIKLIKSSKGSFQNFEINNIDISKEFKDKLNDKMLLIYTGNTRESKNLLKEIMGKYINKDKATLETLKQIKSIPIKMAQALINENLEEFSKLLNEHWELSIKLDKNCVNKNINNIVDALSPIIQGKMICGAGGGGFIYVILKENNTKEEAKNILNSKLKDSSIVIYNFNI